MDFLDCESLIIGKHVLLFLCTILERNYQSLFIFQYVAFNSSHKDMIFFLIRHMELQVIGPVRYTS